MNGAICRVPTTQHCSEVHTDVQQYMNIHSRPHFCTHTTSTRQGQNDSVPKKDSFHGLWWPPIQLTKSAKWDEEKSVDSFGRKLNWELDSELGRKQTAHRMCFWAGQEEKPELQLCLLTLCSNRKVQSFPYITTLDLRAPWVFVLTTFKYVGNFCLGALFIFCGIHYSKS